MDDEGASSKGENGAPAPCADGEATEGRTEATAAAGLMAAPGDDEDDGVEGGLESEATGDCFNGEVAVCTWSVAAPSAAPLAVLWEPVVWIPTLLRNATSPRPNPRSFTFLDLSRECAAAESAAPATVATVEEAVVSGSLPRGWWT